MTRSPAHDSIARLAIYLILLAICALIMFMGACSIILASDRTPSHRRPATRIMEVRHYV